MTYTTPFYRIASHHVASPARLASSCAAPPSSSPLILFDGSARGCAKKLLPPPHPTTHDAVPSIQHTQRTPSCLAIPATKPRTAARPRQEPSPPPRATTRMTPPVCLCLGPLCLSCLTRHDTALSFTNSPTDHCIALCTSPQQQNYNGYAPPPQPGYGYQSSPQPYGFNGGVRTTYLTPCSPNPPPSHQAARHRITSSPIADRARVPQPPPQQQYGYNAPPQGQYGRPSELLLSVRAHRNQPSGTYAPF